MSHNEIDAIIDDRTKSYAVAWLEQSHGYGHMNVVIHLPAATEYSWRPECVIKVTCQIGGETRETHKPYCQKWGLETRFSNSPISVEEIEMAAKLMRKIQRKLDSMNESTGFSDEYAELCQRVLIASGVKHLIAEPTYWANGGRLPDKKLLKAGSSDSMLWLIKAERALIERFEPKVA